MAQPHPRQAVGLKQVDENDPLFQRIKRQLQIDSWIEEGRESGTRPLTLTCPRFTYARQGNQHVSLTEEERDALFETFCSDMCAIANEPVEYVAQMDSLFSQICECRISENFDTHDVAAETHDLLSRLPIVPLPLPDASDALTSGCLTRCPSRDKHCGELTWSDVNAVTFVTTNVIRMAIGVAVYKTPQVDLVRLLDLVANLLRTASRLSSKAVTTREKADWFILRAFLWASWQRMNQLHFHAHTCMHVNYGFCDADLTGVFPKRPDPTVGLSFLETSYLDAAREKPDYMCGYAFELVRNHACAIGLDFRGFFERFSVAFGNKRGRCFPDQQSSCRTGESIACQRFRSTKVEDQSAHDIDCLGACARMPWQKKSYLGVQGAKAVSIDNDVAASFLSYRKASDQTMAISHVWSHGQGGRPEDGFNDCLHRRYRTIARSLGCDSYWLDAACIPEDEELRKEAIMGINEVFENSKLTLICDRDIMSISTISTDNWVQVCETILVTIIVCDWNLRAWTFLEAFRGRSNTYVLCKDNNVISLRGVVQTVCHEGSLDVALFINTIPQLLPAMRLVSTYEGGRRQPGFLGVETSASFLSPREASRKGDDMVIWSLLLGDKVYSDADHFWKSQSCMKVNLTFLLSSAPRLTEKGWRWAPASPTAEVLQDPSGPAAHRVLASGGDDGGVGLITAHGLESLWLMHVFLGGRRGSRMANTMLRLELQQSDPQHQRNLDQVRQIYLRSYFWGALLLPPTASSLDVLFLPRSTSKTPVVVVGTNRPRFWPKKGPPARWTWLGVYEWDLAEQLPDFWGSTDKTDYIYLN